ncbi:MobP2 family relaxase [Lacticaseibacillus suibinensis]|uniref:MobP2 family relaxase n=1 Tax=Lacticaseibacillus suibinensis TaxID=2486011 RepID=UPI001943CFC7|nr:MobP2 family relaxase [Lacticaseibacillus suibinensis]
MSKSPGIVTVMKFVPAADKKFTGYVNYMDRPDAMRGDHFKDWNVNRFDGYNNYMNNPEKSKGLFTAGKDSLSQEERTELKRQFALAQKNGSLMWQTVVSFDNRFLADHGLYDLQSKQLDQAKIQESIRNGMSGLLINEGLANTAVWSASIHLNTDNIHVHIAFVEPEPTRRLFTLDDSDGGTHQEARGMLKPATISAFKSSIANELINRNQSLARLSSLIRNELPQHDYDWGKLPNFDLLRLYQQIYKALPDDKRKWKYNMNALQEVRPLLDAFSSKFMQRYHGKELQEFDQALKAETDFREALYGSGQEGKEAGRAKDYEHGKYNELYARMGNSILSEMRKTDDAVYRKEHPNGFSYHKAQQDQPNQGIFQALSSIRRALTGDMKARAKAQRDYERMQDEKEADHQRQQNQGYGPER